MLTPTKPASVPKDDPRFGRLTIYTDAEVIDSTNIVDVLTLACSTHQLNKQRINFLWNYYKGDQPVLHREKKIRDDICARIVENRANQIVSFKTGYLIGEPMQYVAHGSDEGLSDKIMELNDYMSIEDKAAKDKELADWMHIAGTAYRMVLPSEEEDSDDPFNLFVPDPRYTFVVYSSKLGHKPMLGVQLVVREDGTEVYSCYTDREFYVVTDGNITNRGYHIMGMVPVIEYPLNTAKLGAFEIVLSLLDAINDCDSDRLDGLDQFIQSFIKFINCDVDEETFTAMKELGAIKVKTQTQGMPADVEIISQELNQSQTQVLKDDLYQTVLEICGIPSQGDGLGSESSNNGAVVLRNGWQSAEARAKDTELMFKRSERLMLKAVLRILSITSGLDLKTKDIDMAFTRRNYSDLMTKSQVLTTMLTSNKIHPQLAFSHCGMFVDPESAYIKSKEYAEEQERKEQAQLQQQQKLAISAQKSGVDTAKE